MMNKATCISTMIGNMYIRHCSQASRFKGKVALISGATRGIGLATARRFAQEGAKVIISSRKQKNVDEALQTLHSEGLEVTGLASHVSKESDRRALLYEAENLGGIDILFQNAGAHPNPGKIVDCTEGMWDKTMDTNLKASFFLAKESLPLIQKRGGGSIIFMSSIAAYSPFKAGGAVYSVSKGGLLVLTKAMAGEFAEYNIRVNCVAPGIIDTEFARILGPHLDELLKTVPLNRCGKTEDVSGVVAFLASQDASFITGETIVISGGMISRI
ncbi:hypothetical protein PPYR_02503 [Photinus pyralis]|uniref:Dehydrogenase/reductase SDR family member 4 n=1 Tax=Photinus pyralis TaxID=7054 RepID=A0A5N4B7L4_PHOPY|nr:dehydrogenase/reductase SDR family member 4-like [Photinus pyralis]KAB0805533.1 hypothetical protein PPYR_02503 [Photinus pyralis]